MIKKLGLFVLGKNENLKEDFKIISQKERNQSLPFFCLIIALFETITYFIWSSPENIVFVGSLNQIQLRICFCISAVSVLVTVIAFYFYLKPNYLVTFQYAIYCSYMVFIAIAATLASVLDVVTDGDMTTFIMLVLACSLILRLPITAMIVSIVMTGLLFSISLLVLDSAFQASPIWAAEVGAKNFLFGEGILSTAIVKCATTCSFGILCFIMIQNYRLRLEQLTLTDPLTGIYNRRTLNMRLPELWKTCSRTNTPISAMMIDIDFFKQFNDTYGHIKGDECLKVISRCISLMLSRSTDFVARFGGEEFCVIIPFTSPHDVMTLAGKLKKSIEEKEIVSANRSVSNFVTVSIGAVTMFPSRGAKMEDLIASADEQLYKVKMESRNGVSHKIN